MNVAADHILAALAMAAVPLQRLSMFEIVKGDMIVVGARRGMATVRAVTVDGAFADMNWQIPRFGLLHNDREHIRIIGVPIGSSVRLYWVSGPSARPLAWLAQVGHRKVKRYVRRQRWQATLRQAWAKITGEA